MKRAAAILFGAAILASVLPASSEAGPPRFSGTVRRIDPATRREMTGVSWHAGCPRAIRDLRLLRLSYWTFGNAVRKGELVVARRWARPVLRVFAKLFRAHFPIRRMRRVDAYGGDDDRSMAADNTSAFNCRYVAGKTTWSEHAYGRAIDIDPVENPYVTGDHVSPPAGRKYRDRSNVRPGMIVEGGVVVRAFASIGWGWGGRFHSAKDYQHFSSTGR